MKSAAFRTFRLLALTLLTGLSSWALAIAPNPITLTSPSTLTEPVNSFFNSAITVTNGTAPYTFSLASNSNPLPSGVNLSSSGNLSGNPSVVSSNLLNIQVTDSVGKNGSVAIQLNVTQFGLTGPQQVAAAVGAHFVYAFQTNGGGIAPVTYSVTGMLPAGLTFNPIINKIVGTPTTAGVATVTLNAMDAAANASSQPLEIDVTNVAYTGASNVIFINNAATFSYQLTAAGGTPSYGYAVTGGTLPAGLSLSSSGVLSGISTAVVNNITPVTVTITDAAQPTANTTTTVINVAAQNFGIPSPQVTTGTVGSAFSFTLPSAVGGVTPVTLSGNSNVPGVTFVNSTGTFSGVPSSGGSFSEFVNVVDHNGAQAPSTTVLINIPVTPLTLVQSTSNTTFAQNFNSFTGGTASGGVTPYVYTLSGTLPSGLAFNANNPGNQISGSATALGSFPVTLTVFDATGNTASIQIPLTVAKMTISSSLTASAISGVFFSYNTVVNGGSGGITFAATGLPPGLALNSNGRITGFPTTGLTASIYPVTITATDSSSNNASITLTISAGPLGITGPNSFTAIMGQPYSYQLTAAGDTSPYTYTLANGSLPANFSLSSSGLITGTGTTPVQPTSITIRVTDSRTPSPIVSNFSATFQVNSFGVPSPISVSGMLNFPFTYKLPVAGGTSPYFFSGPSTPAPGLTFNSTTGTITGTPTSPGTYTPFFNFSDSGGLSSSTQNFSIVIPALPMTVTQQFLATNIITSSAYFNQLTVTGGVQPYTYAVVSGSLPLGINLTPSGSITGSPTTAANYLATIQVTDSVGSTVNTTLTLNVASFGINNGNPAVGAAGAPYETQFTASGNTGTVTYSATQLPTGVVMLSNGVLTGVFPTAGAYFPAITATDTGGHSVTNTYAITIQPFLSTTPGTFSIVTGTPYSYQFTESGSTGPFTYTVSSGSLPNGMSLSSSGLLSGTWSSSFFASQANVTIADGVGNNITVGISFLFKSYGISTPVTFPAATAGQPFTYTFQAAGGTSPYTYALGSTSFLPSGLTLSSAGVLSGTPTQGTRTFTFNVVATDSSPSPAVSAPATVTIGITPLPLALTSSNPQTTVLVNTTYSTGLNVTGGYSPYVVALGSGLLAPGLILTNTSLSGPVNTAGLYTPTLTATDSAGTVVTLNTTLNVATYGITNGSIQSGAIGVPVSLNINTSGLTSPLTYSATGLPPGLNLNTQTGLVNGTPTAAGVFLTAFTVTDSSSTVKTTTNPIQFTIQALSLNSLGTAVAIAGTPYSFQIPVSGGTGPYTFALNPTSSLPANLSMSSSGLITGTGTTATTTSSGITYTVTDHAGHTATGNFNIGVRSFGIVGPIEPPTATAGVPFSYTLTAVGGTAPYTYTVSGLPSGLSLNSATGVISGTPTIGSRGFNVTVGATDSSATVQTATSVTMTLVITPAPLTVTSPPVVSGVINNGFNFNLATTGGSGTLSYALSGALPPGMALASSGGTISGTPTTAGSYPVAVVVTDIAGATATYNVTFTIGAFGFATDIQTSTAAVGVGYSLTLTTTGATNSATFTATDLPPGLTISTASGGLNALISGFPTATGTYVATIVGTDGSTPAKTSTATVTYTVRSLIFTGSTAFTSVVGQPYSYQLTVAGGTAPYTYTLASGSLPAGLALGAAGLISGTSTSTTVTGTSGTITITDHVGNTAPLNFSFVNRTFGMNSPQTFTGAAGSAVSFQPVVSGGTSPYSFTTGSVPNGLLLNGATGQITGTTSSGGLLFVNLSATDSTSPTAQTAAATMVLNLTPLPLTATFFGAPSQQVNVPYNNVFIITNGGVSPYTYTLAGSLPPGMTFGSNGAVSGTPTTPGSYSATVTVADKNGSTVTVPIAISVGTFGFPFGTINPTYVVNNPIAFNDSATGGVAPVTYTATGLPPGLTYGASTGLFSGSATTAGSYVMTLTAKDATNKTVSTVFHITVVPMQVTSSTTVEAIVGLSYSYQVQLLGGTAPFTFTLPVGTTLPTGLSFSSSGLIGGTATVSRNSVSIPVTITDKNGGTITTNFFLGSSTNGIATPQIVTGTYGTPLTYQISLPSGGVPPFTFTSNPALLQGLSFTTAGAITGTPLAAGSFFYTVSGSDSSGGSGTLTIDIYIASVPPTIAQQPSPQTVVAGGTATFTVTAAGPGPYTYGWFKNGNPLGVSTQTLTLTNVPFGSDGQVTVVVTSPYGQIPSQPALLTVNPVAPVLPATGAGTAVVGSSFTYTPTSNGTKSTYTLNNPLPTGLVLDSTTGVISGTATAPLAATPFTLTATNVTGSSSEVFTLTVAVPVPVITTTGISGMVGTALSAQIAATNSPDKISISSLPAGLSSNGSGLVTGTPTTPGTLTVTVTASNSTGSSTAPLTFTIAPAPSAPVYTGSSAASGTEGAAFSYTPVFTGSATSFSIRTDHQGENVINQLPSGLSINATTGAITGSALVAGTFPVTLLATGVGGTTSVPLTITVNSSPNAPTITSASSIIGTAGTTFSFQVVGSNTPTQYGAIGLPSWASLDTTSGIISGTPVAGTTTVTLAGFNTSGVGPTAALVIQINPAATSPIMTSPSSYTVTVGTAITPLVLTASGSPDSFVITSGTLPDGLTLTGGTISGTPFAFAASGTVGIAAHNVAGQGLALLVSFTVLPSATAPVVTSSGSATGQVGQPFSYQIVASNNPSTYGMTGTLPAGLTLDNDGGSITGVPTTATSTAATVTITATSTQGSGSKSLAITIAAPAAAPAVTSSTSAAGQVGVAFTYQISGSNTPTGYAATPLPAGLTVDSTAGVISGTPTAAGTFTVNLQAGNSGGLGTATPLTLVIAAAAAAPVITSAPTALATAGVTFTYTVTATSSATITGYGLTGTLPTGLTFNTSTGVISGSPIAPGTTTVNVTATSSAGTSLPQSVAITVNPSLSAPVVTSGQTVSGKVGDLFDFFLTANFPDAPPFPNYETLDAVGLPPGLGVNPSTGEITGTPTQSGVFSVTVVAQNTSGESQPSTLTITIAPPDAAPVISSGTTASAQAKVAFSYQIAASNAPTSFDAVGAPAWLALSTSSGTLSGTPTAPGTYTVNLSATNGSGPSQPVSLVITVLPAANTPVITSGSTASGTLSTTITPYQIAATPAATGYSATNLPAGVTLDPVSGIISGKPSESGTFLVQLFGTNTNGQGATFTLTLTIQSNLSL